MNSALHPMRLASLCAFALALCSCNGEKTTDRQATAGGEILPGSASDAMLPFDTLRSQPPIAVNTDDGGTPGEPAPSDAPSEAADQPDAEASPASSASATASAPAAE